MTVQKIFKYNLVALLILVLAACSNNSSDEPEEPKPSKNILENHILEGNEDTSVLTLQFVSPITGVLKYNTFNITAAEKSDYIPVSGEITAVKDEIITVDVVIFGDTRIEGDETFGLKFLDNKGTIVGNVTGYIDNDDLPAVSVDAPTVLEGDTGTVNLTFTFSLSEKVVDDYSISIESLAFDDVIENGCSVDASIAAPGVDYQIVSNVLTFTKGETTKKLQVIVNADNLIENDETIVLSAKVNSTSVLTEKCATGVIRTDETPTNNGFQLSFVDSVSKSVIEEGSTEEGASESGIDTWKPIVFEIKVSEPENIIQTQLLNISLLSKETAKTKYQVDEDLYVDLTTDPDICLNSPEQIAVDGCRTLLEYPLEPNIENFSFTAYVKMDLIREVDEMVIIDITNDQGVDFTKLVTTIKNDDSEKLQIKVGDEFVDLKEFTESGRFYEMVEPKAGEKDFNVTFRLQSILQKKYEVDVAFGRYLKKQEIENGEYKFDPQSLVFLTSAEANQEQVLNITLISDSKYDGDKYFQLEFDADIKPLVIKVIDADYPDLEIASNNPIDEEGGYDLLKEENEANPSLGYKEYSYRVQMEDNLSVALSEVEYTLALNKVLSISAPADTSVCKSIGRVNQVDHANLGDVSKPDVTPDVTIFDESGNEVKPGEVFTLKEGFTGFGLKVRVTDDPEIECDEVFELALAPEGADESDGITKKFKMKDTDKALITVKGTSSLESTENVEFIISSNKAVKVSLPIEKHIVDGHSPLNCSTAEDYKIPATQSSTVSINTLDNGSPSFIYEIDIKNDSTVEPNEECYIKVTMDDISDLVEVQYEDWNSTEKTKTFAASQIVNDDKINILFEVSQENDEPAELNDSSGQPVILPLGKVYWGGNTIAENVGDIVLNFEMGGCTDSATIDCIEEGDIELQKEPFIINGAVYNSDSNRYEKALPILILADNIVEKTETLNLTVSSSSDYISSLQSSISSAIINEDKLDFEFSERTESPLVVAENGAESGLRFYRIAWGNKSVSSTVSKIELNLEDTDEIFSSGYGKAIRKTSEDQDKDMFDYALMKGGDEFYGSTLVIKSEGSELLADNSIDLELILNNDELIEIEEMVVVNINTQENSPFYNDFSTSFSHKIGIDDKLSVAVSTLNDLEDSESEEKDESEFVYGISLSGDVADNVPGLSLGLSSTGLADVNNDYTFSISVPAAYSDNVLTLKEGSGDLLSSPISLTYKVKDDDYVETLESIITNISNNQTNSEYIELKNPLGNEIIANSNLLLTHEIISEDDPDFALTQISPEASPTSSEEQNTQSNVYQLSWSNPIGKNIGDIALILDFSESTAERGVSGATGDAIKDYVLSSNDVEKLKISDTDATTNLATFKIIKDSEEVLPKTASVTFTINILDEKRVESDEVVAAEFLEADPSLPDYVSFSENNSLTHTIISDEGVVITLEKTTSATSVSEGGSSEVWYSLTWNEKIEQSVGDITLLVNFGGSATVGSNADYTIDSLSGSDLSVDWSTGVFVIDNPSGGLTANESVSFRVRINDDDLVEPDEEIVLSLETHANTPSAISIATVSNSVSIPVDPSDKAVLSIEETSSISSSAGEGSVGPFVYELKWNENIAANTPALFVDVPLTGNASMDDISVVAEKSAELIIVRGDDESIPVLDRFDGYRFTFKDEGEALNANGTEVFTVSVINDDIVETNEIFSGTLTAVGTNPLETYITYHASDNSLSTHTIINTDFITLTLTEHSGNAAKSGNAENTATTLTYTLGWNKAVASDVPALIVDLPLNGNASLADFDITEGTGLSVSGDAYTFKTLGTALAAGGFVTFNYTIVDDNEVEIDETISAEMELDTTTYTYLSNYVQLSGTSNSLSHVITPDADKTEISLTRAASTPDAADEDDESDLTYILAWTNPVASDVPALAVDLSLSGSAATEDSDFTVNTLPTGLTRSGDVFTFKALNTAIAANGSYNISMSVTDEFVVEIPEAITASLSASGSLLTYASISTSDNSISHTINNDDKTELSLAIASGGSSSAEASESTVTFNLVSSLEVASDVPDLEITLEALSGTATPVSDYTFTDLNSKEFSAPISAGTVIGTFSIDIKNESIVEEDETFIATLGLDSGTTNSYAQLGASNNVVSHAINNDDYIQLALVTTDGCTGATCIRAEGGSIKFKPSASYVVEGLTPSLSVSIEPSSTAESTDYSFGNLGSYSLDSSYNDANTAAPVHTVLTMPTDTIIEIDKQVDLKWTIPSYIQFMTAPSAVIIKNDDYLAISVNYYSGASDSTPNDVLLEGELVKLQTCIPSGYSMASGASALPITYTISDPGETKSATFKSVAASDFIVGQLSESKNINIATLTTPGCIEQTLFTVITDIGSQNKSFDLNITTSDPRCEGSHCGFDAITDVIYNDDFTSVTDTGLTECIKNADKNGDRDQVACGSVADKNDKQDAEKTTAYSDLTYTYINSLGKNSVTMPLDLSDGPEFCFQDNVTGIIWSQPQYDGTDYLFDYDDTDEAISNWNCALSFVTTDWSLPSVDQLMSLMNLNPQSELRPLGSNVLGFMTTGSNFTNTGSEYWTSNICDFDHGGGETNTADGAWVVDMHMGHVYCKSQSDTAHRMKILN